MTTSDLYVEPVSHALAGTTIEVIVTGSIGAVEAVRLIRALRRLGADTRVTLSQGGGQFITPMALEWASNHPVQTDFSGTASHVASADACVVAPASASFIEKLATGRTDSPSAALATSYSGTKKPLILVPAMHSSLANAPAVKRNIDLLRDTSVILGGREEEGKTKFPNPSSLADTISHHVNYKSARIVVAFGGTQAALDDVRFLGNYSTGSLGTHITEELYRRGFAVHAVVGTAEVLPASFSQLERARTNATMEQACKVALRNSSALVFAPAILDYVPDQAAKGKLTSGQSGLSINLTPTKKILSELNVSTGLKVGFKLEVRDMSAADKQVLAEQYCRKYGLSLLIMNQLKDIGEDRHRAYLFYANDTAHPKTAETKSEIADLIVNHLGERLG